MSRNFNSPRLIRLLDERAPTNMDPFRQDVAERLSLWLGAMDSVKLHAALQSIHAAPEEAAPDAVRLRALFHSVEDDFHRVQDALVNAIMAVLPSPELAPALVTDIDIDINEADYAADQKRHLDLQRLMESKIGPLRARLRQALMKASPGLSQLAALDAVLEQTLGIREQKLLSTVPMLLEKRFKHGRKTHQPHQFRQEWQAALLAELDVRLQPVMGLMEAFTNEVKKHA